MTWKTDHDVVQALLEGARDRLRSLSPADTSEALLVIHNLREVAAAASMTELIPILDSVSNELALGTSGSVERSLSMIQEHLSLARECFDTDIDDVERCFEGEAAGHLEVIRERLALLDNDDVAGEALGEISRAAHTLKGAAAMMGRQEAASAAHLLEDLFEEVNQGHRHLDAGLLSKLNQAVDLLEALVEKPDLAKEIEVALLVLLEEHGELDVKSTAEIALDLPLERRRRRTDRRRDTSSVARLSSGSIRRFDELHRLSTRVSSHLKAQLNKVTDVAADLSDLGELILEGAPQNYTFVERIIAAKGQLRKAADDIEREAESLARTARLTRENMDELRMIRASWIFDQLVSAAKAAQQVERHLAIQRVGEDVLIDRHLASWLLDQLQHVVRNAVAHGLEEPAQRIAHGKEPSGRLTMEVWTEAGSIHVAIEDDGRGIDLDAIRRRVVSMGLRTEEEAARADLDESLEWIFMAGVSSRSSADHVAGRGVGLETVRAEVEGRGGMISVITRPGRGTRFEVQLPNEAECCAVLKFTVADVPLALPLSVVRGVGTAQGETSWKERLPLGDLLGLPKESDSFFWIETNEGTMLEVDSIEGVAQVVIHTTKGRLAKIGPYIGVGIGKDDESLRLVLDHGGIRGQLASKALKILLVEDSRTVRKILAQGLMASGFHVDEAVDGFEALEIIKRSTVDLVVTDLDMPRLDGFELLASLRQDPAFDRLPVVIVTSNSSDEARQLAKELGASNFVLKASGQEELTRAIRAALEKKEKPLGRRDR